MQIAYEQSVVWSACCINGKQGPVTRENCDLDKSAGPEHIFKLGSEWRSPPVTVPTVPVYYQNMKW